MHAFRHWDQIDIFFKGRKISSGGHGFSGIARRSLLNILQRRALTLGVELQFGVEVRDPTVYATTHDLVVAADGVNSTTRQRYAAIFNPRREERKCRFLWLGTERKLDAFTFDFQQTEAGWFNLHAYRFDESMSTVIVETPETVWRQAGIDRMTPAESIGFCEKLFAERLAGHALISNASHLRGSAIWQKFNSILCERWHHDNIVLIGDAAHTAHFAVGSGTKQAMEDAIVLAAVLVEQGTISERLQCYQNLRQTEALKLQNAARNRMEWFENVERHARLESEQFAYSLLTGSQRVGHDNLKQRDSGYIASYEAWFAQRSGAPAATPPMFTPFRLRGLELKNRVVVSPMATYSCSDGLPDDFLLVHLGSRALGGAGLVMTEMTAVAPEARITPGCAGIWNEEQTAAWRRIVAFTHRHSTARIGIQLGHAGPKGSTQRGWEAIDEPLAEGNWPLLAASPLAYGPQNQMPRALDRADMERICEQFAAATRRAASADFDLIELHCAHGYLLSSFLSPLTNRREDEYGGAVDNRCRFPLQVFAAIRAAWPQQKPISVRISAHDWAPGGNTAEDAVAIARLFKAAGADLIDVSSGQTTRAAQPVYGRMYQTPFADQIRGEVGIATIAVGNIFTPDHVNTIIAAGRADLCALGRPHLADPAWTLHAASALGYGGADWPVQYSAGKE
jgi:anthraniloyl-CoA monooxygenase